MGACHSHEPSFGATIENDTTCGIHIGLFQDGKIIHRRAVEPSHHFTLIMRPSNPYRMRLLVSDRNGPIAEVFPPDNRSTHTRVSVLYVHSIQVFSADAVVVMPDDVLAIGQSINA